MLISGGCEGLVWTGFWKRSLTPSLSYSLCNFANSTPSIDFSVCAHEAQSRVSPAYSSPGWERESEHRTPPAFISISHQIRSLEDKSTSWDITSSLWRKLTRAGNPKRQGGWWEMKNRNFFLTEVRVKGAKGWLKDRDGREDWIGKDHQGRSADEIEVAGNEIRQRKGESFILVSQISTAMYDVEEAEQWETKRWRGTKNSITGLALTLTFIH